MVKTAQERKAAGDISLATRFGIVHATVPVLQGEPGQVVLCAIAGILLGRDGSEIMVAVPVFCPRFF